MTYTLKVKINDSVPLWAGEIGLLEDKMGDFYNVRPDSQPDLRLALKDTEFEVI